MGRNIEIRHLGFDFKEDLEKSVLTYDALKHKIVLTFGVCNLAYFLQTMLVSSGLNSRKL